MLDSASIGMIAAMVVMVICSAYFSATETAFTSLNRIRLKSKADAGDRRAARALALVEPILTQQERDVVRRARNARQTPTKNAQTAAYHRATALEAVLGYLYLTGQQERLDDIMRLILKDGKE